MFQKS